MSYNKKVTCPHCLKEMPMAKVVNHTFGEIEQSLLIEKRKVEIAKTKIAMTIDAEREKAAEKVHNMIIELSEREQQKLKEKDEIISKLEKRILELEC